MPITQQQKTLAQAKQDAAAHDSASQVRLIAGPGTGKSASVEERIRWILSQGCEPSSVFAVSFTRAAAKDLRLRVQTYCKRKAQPGGDQVSVTTLHSLALRLLRSANLLSKYPASPMVLDSWETEHVFDEEFGAFAKKSKTRREGIRRYHEAFWSTGTYAPVNYVPPDPPISPQEITQFLAFHGPATQTYCCVLPGELVRECVEHMNAGTLDPVARLRIDHLIVDEFQDLNPMDLDFVDFVVRRGVKVFIAGDDDQSIYSFRHANPAGIQTFDQRHPATSSHTLTDCFRCTPDVLNAAQTLMTRNPSPGRLMKAHVSLYEASQPPVHGVVHRWKCKSDTAEARAIAASCRDLIQAGVPARQILVLLSDKRQLGPKLKEEFTRLGVDYEPPKAETFVDTKEGRATLALVRIANDPDDYVAHRVLLGVQQGVGPVTCRDVADKVITNNLNYKNVFHQPIPPGVFGSKATKAIAGVAAAVSAITGWAKTDTVGQRRASIGTVLGVFLGPSGQQAWQTYSASLPADMNLEELRNFLWADTDEQQEEILKQMYDRLGRTPSQTSSLPPKVRMMTMHGAKGLSAQVVFVPGLEQGILPGPRRQPYPGLVLEAGRLLYVSITRARAACILTFAATRMVQGKFTKPTPSTFATQTGGAFSYRETGLNADEVREVVDAISAL